MRRGREREREREESSWGWKGLQSEGGQLLTTMIPVYMYPQKKEKAYQVLESTYSVGSIKVQQRERRWEGGVVLLVISHFVHTNFPLMKSR